MTRSRKPSERLVWDYALKAYRPYKRGWKHPNPYRGPRDRLGQFLPRALVRQHEAPQEPSASGPQAPR